MGRAHCAAVALRLRGKAMFKIVPTPCSPRLQTRMYQLQCQSGLGTAQAGPPRPGPTSSSQREPRSWQRGRSNRAGDVESGWSKVRVLSELTLVRSRADRCIEGTPVIIGSSPASCGLCALTPCARFRSGLMYQVPRMGSHISMGSGCDLSLSQSGKGKLSPFLGRLE